MSSPLALTLHTVIFSIGPSNSGKTTYFNDVLIPQIRKQFGEFKPNIQYLSTDSIRRELVGDLDKQHPRMIEVSKLAFEVLYAKLRAVMSYPTHAEFVIVDSTGLSESFRKQLTTMCKQYEYNSLAVVFTYSNTNVYRKLAKSANSTVIFKHMAKLQSALSNLKNEDIGQKLYIRELVKLDDQFGYVIIKNINCYLRNFLQDKKYLVIGDLHTCIDEFRQLVLDQGFTIDNDSIVRQTEKSGNMEIVLVGDLFDKGTAEKNIETLEFMYKNSQHPDNIIRIVRGNHDRFVWDLIKKPETISQFKDDFVMNYFNSYYSFKDTPEYVSKFNALYETMYEFLIYRAVDNYNSNSFIVTHSPCPNKYLGKLSNHAIKAQQYFHLARELCFVEQLKFMTESEQNYPYHIFGHIALKDVYNGIYEKNNNIGIDTGSIYGNKLTGVIVGRGYTKPKVVHVKYMAKQPKLEYNLITLRLVTEEEKINNNIDTLTPHEVNRLNYVIGNKINFISGTICPADKDEANNKLESLDKALEYFRDNYGKQISLQPKYMGSRLNVYLSRDPTKCFAVSRNGYKLTTLDLSVAYSGLLSKLDAYMTDNDIETVIVDGELMPWSAMGSGLIEQSFQTINIGLNSELSLLKEFGFDSIYNETIDKVNNSDYITDKDTLKKAQLDKKYGHLAKMYKVLLAFNKTHTPLGEETKQGSIYNDQLNIYGSSGEVHYKPFSILKYIKTDGEEVMPDGQVELYSLVSDDEQLVVDFETEDFDAISKRANEFFNKLTVEQHMEGVVIKPNTYDEGVAHCMKVRNEDYLTIIYGYDYKHPLKYKNQIAKKSINNKLKTSIAEYKLGRKMLQTPLADINDDNKHYKNLLINFLFEEHKEKTDDPRL